MSSKVAAITGVHTSASALLAEAMADPDCKRVIVFYWSDAPGAPMIFGHFDISGQEAAYAAACLLQESQRG